MSYTRKNQIDLGKFQRKTGTKKSRAAFHKLFRAEPKLVRSHKIKFTKPALYKTFSFAMTGFVLVFVVQALVYLASAKNATGEILGAATDAYGQLDSASKNLTVQDLSSARTLFQEASANIDKAQQRLNEYKILTWVTPQANSAHHILMGSGFLAEAGSKLTEAFDLFEDLKVTSGGVEVENFNQKISSNKKSLTDSQALISKSLDEFAQASSIPTDYEGAFGKAQDQLRQLEGILASIIRVEDLYLNLFSGEKTYLLVFQNYDEARATGGFLGTYGSLKTSSGSIQSLKIESIYNLDGQITTAVAAPGPFQPAIKKWGIRDANWFVDFRESANKLLYFYEKGKETANGVLALTPKTFVELLQITGPIDMPDYGVTLTSENFQDMVQFKTSVDYDKVLNQPKKFLDDFAPRLLDRLSVLQKEQWVQVLGVITQNLNSRNIMMYSTDPVAQGQIESLGFSGKILNTDFDYLSINSSNLGGTKTDMEIQEKAILESKILSDGSIKNTLHISRSNTSSEPNRSYLRILVPEGSQMISAVGFDKYEYYRSESENMKTDPDLAAWDQGEIRSELLVHKEAGKTEFSGWVETAGMGSRTITLTYILPFKIQPNSFDPQSYSLLIQKQPGAVPLDFQTTFDIGGLRAVWTSDGARKSGSFINFNSRTDTDDFWALVLEP